MYRGIACPELHSSVCAVPIVFHKTAPCKYVLVEDSTI